MYKDSNKLKHKGRLMFGLMFLIVLITGLCALLIPVESSAQASAFAGPAASFIPGIIKNVGEAALFTLLAWILYVPIHFFGFLVSNLLIPLMIFVASYNNFLTQEGVAIGWTVVRDLANIIVVLGVLVIVFGTLFKIETYDYKKLLPKLVMAAVLINFSKTIIGFLIDISQVIMLTFVHSFDKIAAGNLIYGIGLTKILSLATNTGAIGQVISSGAGLEILGALILGVLVLIITAGVITVIISYLIARIIMLWLAVILSPLLFILPFVPSGEKFAKQVWGLVSKYLITGPLLAFFLWLSFTIISQVQGDVETIIQSPGVLEASDQFAAFISEFGNINNILNFMVAIGLLIASLVMASQMGVAGSKMAGNFVSRLQAAGKASTLGLAKVSALGAGRKLDKGLVRMQQAVGIKRPMSFRPSIIKTAWDEGRKRKEERFYKGRGVTGGMEDRFNRLMSGGKDKTDQQKIERDSYVAARKKEIDAGGTQETILRKRLMEIGTIDKETGTYVVKKGMESDFEAILQTLTENHDINEIFKDEKMGEKYGRKFTPRNLSDFVVSAIGKKEGARVLTDIGHIGFMNNDTQLKGLADMDVETGEFELIDLAQEEGKGKSILAKHMKRRFDWHAGEAKERERKGEATKIDEEILRVAREKGGDMNELKDEARLLMIDEKQGKIAALFQAKKAGRPAVSGATRQMFDSETNEGMVGKLSTQGKQILLELAEPMSEEYGHARPETKEWLEDHVGEIKAFADGTEVNDMERKNLYQVMNRIIGGDRRDNDLPFDDLEKKVGARLPGFEKLISQKREGTNVDGVDHEEEISKKTTTIDENKEKIIKLREEETIARMAKESNPVVSSDEYKKNKETEEQKKKEADELEGKNKQFEQDIIVNHYPGRANQVVQGLGGEALVDPEAVSQLGQQLSDEINKALGNVELGRVDFSKLEDSIKKISKGINKNINPGNPTPDFNFATRANMEQGGDKVAQAKILNQLQRIALSLKNKAIKEQK